MGNRELKNMGDRVWLIVILVLGLAVLITLLLLRHTGC